MITAYADFYRGEACGCASDLVLKPFRSNQIVNSLRRIEVAQLKRENQALRRALAI